MARIGGLDGEHLQHETQLGALVGQLQEADGGAQGRQTLGQRQRGVRVHPAAGRGEGDEEPRQQTAHQGHDTLKAGAAHVAVPRHRGQGLHRRGQGRHVRGLRRAGLHRRQNHVRGRRQLAPHRRSQQRRQTPQIAGVGAPGRLFPQGGVRGLLHRRAQARGRHQLQGELRAPRQRPRLSERAQVAFARCRHRPGQPQDLEPREQTAALPVQIRAEIQLQRLLFRGLLQAQAFGRGLQIARQGHRGRLGGHGAHRLTRLQVSGDERVAGLVPGAQDRQDRLAQLGQAGLGQVAQGRQGLGQTHGLDDTRRGRVQIAGAQRMGRRGDPIDRRERLAVAVGPEVGVPARGAHAGPIARARRKTPVGPRDERGLCLDLRLVQGRRLEQLGVWFGRPQTGQHRGVPRATDHRHPLGARLQGPAQHLAHVGLAAQRRRPCVGHLRADGLHR